MRPLDPDHDTLDPQRCPVVPLIHSHHIGSGGIIALLGHSLSWSAGEEMQRHGKESQWHPFATLPSSAHIRYGSIIALLGHSRPDHPARNHNGTSSLLPPCLIADTAKKTHAHRSYPDSNLALCLPWRAPISKYFVIATVRTLCEYHEIN